MNPFKHKKFSSLAFLKKPEVAIIDGNRVEFLGFCKPENSHKPAIAFLGGAFQSFFSFKKEVQVLMEDHPIIMIDLPGQGSNRQLSGHLSFSDFAHLLKKFIDHVGLNKITPIGLSYGSATVYHYALYYPDRVDKLIMGGTSKKVRCSVRTLLTESIQLMEKGEMDLFSQGVVMNLINFTKKHITKIPQRILQGFHKNMMKLNSNDQQRYKDNTNRLLSLDGIPSGVQCQTLVSTGEFDNFTSPYEGFQVSQLIPNSTFLLIKGTDHLANLERRDKTIEIYQNFLSDQSLHTVEDIIIPTIEEMASRERRLDQRISLDNKVAHITNKKGRTIRAKIRDINYIGFSLDLNDQEKVFLKEDSSFEIKIENLKNTILTALHLKEGCQSRFIFRRGNFQEGERLQNYIDSLSEPIKMAL